MKKYFVTIAILFSGLCANAQILSTPLVIQEQDQWCWAGCSKCILNYYGDSVSECQIAEYARTQITWTSFGTTNCCVTATAGCNYWNYNWGYNGSIQDILVHFDSVVNIGANVLTPSQVKTQVLANHLFVEHWSWPGGGGHFVVGHGVAGTLDSTASIYYMNPWPGEGLGICNYAWMVTGTNDMGDHTWDATNQITSYKQIAPSGVNELSQTGSNATIYPNPSTGDVWVKGNTDNQVDIFNTTGKLVYNAPLKDNTTPMDLGHLPKGMYIVKIKSAAGNTVTKLLLQ